MLPNQMFILQTRVCSSQKKKKTKKRKKKKQTTSEIGADPAVAKQKSVLKLYTQ